LQQQQQQQQLGSSGRFLFDVQINPNLSINLVPFLLLVKVAFLLGLLLKDALANSMEDWMTSSLSYGWDDDDDDLPSFYSPSSYYVAGGSATAKKDASGSSISSESQHFDDDSFRYVGTANIVPTNEEEETSLAEHATSMLGAAAEMGFNAASWLIGSAASYMSSGGGGGDIDDEDDLLYFPPSSNIASVSSAFDNYHSTAAAAASQLPPLEPGQYLASSPTPAHYVTRNKNDVIRDDYFSHFVDEDDIFGGGAGGLVDGGDGQQATPSVGGGSSLTYDPHTKTLFIDRESAALLQLEDGDTLPVPNDILNQAISEGQVHLLRESSAAATLQPDAAAAFKGQNSATTSSTFPVQNSLAYSNDVSGIISNSNDVTKATSYAPVRNLFHAAKVHNPLMTDFGLMPGYLNPVPVRYPPSDAGLLAASSPHSGAAQQHHDVSVDHQSYGGGQPSPQGNVVRLPALSSVAAQPVDYFQASFVEERPLNVDWVPVNRPSKNPLVK